MKTPLTNRIVELLKKHGHTEAAQRLESSSPSGSASCSPLRFTAADSEAANKAWKATCGPHSIAAACALTLDQVRVALDGYKGWMSPTQITATLRKLERPFVLTANLKTKELCEGINRIQWEGPWLNPGVPARVAYFRTHYVAHFHGMVLCTACLSAQWIPVEEWLRHHLVVEPVTPFHVTHHWTLAKEKPMQDGYCHDCPNPIECYQLGRCWPATLPANDAGHAAGRKTPI